MTALVLGLLIFLGLHSVRIVAEPWRAGLIQRRGEKAYKKAYTVLSLLGFALIIWGYGQARQQPVALWTPQPWARHLAAPLTLLAFVLLAASHVPGNAIKARLGHPMLLGVKLWALAHLLANHTLADLLLFGGFLLWAVLCFRAARQRDRQAQAEGAAAPLVSKGKTLWAVVAGVAAWAVFALLLHAPLIGVRPY